MIRYIIKVDAIWLAMCAAWIQIPNVSNAHSERKIPMTDCPYAEWPIHATIPMWEFLEADLEATHKECAEVSPDIEWRIRHCVAESYKAVGAPPPGVDMAIETNWDGMPIRITLDVDERRIFAEIDEYAYLYDGSLDGSVTMPCPMCEAEPGNG